MTRFVVQLGYLYEDEIEAFREETNAQREKVREALAENLGGKPEDYDVQASLSN